MSKKQVANHQAEPIDDTGFILKWGKLATRITAIGATILGAFAALFSTSSIASGVALTAAGASTFAATEKLPGQRYVKTKHIPPLPASRTHRAVLAPDILPKPEVIIAKPKQTQLGRTESRIIKPQAPVFRRTKI